MRHALFAAGPPIAIFLALWLYVRAENTRVDRASRRRTALLASGSFLILPVLIAPVVFDNSTHAEVYSFREAVCATCSFGLALTALRTMPSREIAPLMLMALSGAYVSLIARMFLEQRF